MEQKNGGGGEMKITLGAMEFGRRADAGTSKKMVEFFLAHGGVEIDTAYVYSGGKSETILGELLKEHKGKVQVHTKVNPRPKGGLSPEGLTNQFETSLQRLGLESVELLYLHAPDYQTPVKDTLAAVQKLYEKGLFKELGLSNYASWQVTEVYYIMKMNGWVLPTVYQGMYNAITREVERELFPAIRNLGIRFYAYNLLAGGILSGKHKFDLSEDKQPTSRFFHISNTQQYRDRYWRKENFESVEQIKAACKAAYGDEVGILEASIRWLCHHSQMDASKGDSILLGVSTLSHLETNMKHINTGPLKQEVLDAFDAAWERVKPATPSYSR